MRCRWFRTKTASACPLLETIDRVYPWRFTRLGTLNMYEIKKKKTKKNSSLAIYICDDSVFIFHIKWFFNDVQLSKYYTQLSLITEVFRVNHNPFIGSQPKSYPCQIPISVMGPESGLFIFSINKLFFFVVVVFYY